MIKMSHKLPFLVLKLYFANFRLQTKVLFDIDLQIIAIYGYLRENRLRFVIFLFYLVFTLLTD